MVALGRYRLGNPKVVQWMFCRLPLCVPQRSSKCGCEIAVRERASCVCVRARQRESGGDGVCVCVREVIVCVWERGAKEPQ